MSTSTGDNTKTRKRRPAQTGELVGTRLQPDILAKIDAWRSAQPDIPTRPEAIRRIIDEKFGSEK